MDEAVDRMRLITRKKALAKLTALILAVIVVVSVAAGTGVYLMIHGPVCQPSVQGYSLHIHIENDTGTPISGAEVMIDRIDYCGNSQGSIFTTQTTQVYQGTTPTNGTLTLSSPPVGVYTFSVSYLQKTYTGSAPLAPLNSTTVTVNIPSGKIEVQNSFPS